MLSDNKENDTCKINIKKYTLDMEDIKNTMAEGYLSILNPSPEYENKREKANLQYFQNNLII